jgi:hypothetical protein
VDNRLTARTIAGFPPQIQPAVTTLLTLACLCKRRLYLGARALTDLITPAIHSMARLP